MRKLKGNSTNYCNKCETITHCLTCSQTEKKCTKCNAQYIPSPNENGLVCEECLSRNYTTTKNPQKNVERIETNKYCKHAINIQFTKKQDRRRKKMAVKEKQMDKPSRIWQYLK